MYKRKVRSEVERTAVQRIYGFMDLKKAYGGSVPGTKTSDLGGKLVNIEYVC